MDLLRQFINELGTTAIGITTFLFFSFINLIILKIVLSVYQIIDIGLIELTPEPVLMFIFIVTVGGVLMMFHELGEFVRHAIRINKEREITKAFKTYDVLITLNKKKGSEDADL